MFDYSFEQPYRESNLINLQYKYFPVSLEFFLKIQLKHLPHFLLHKKSSFPSRFSLENVTKSTVSLSFDYIYWRNPWWKTSFFVQCSNNENFNISHYFQVKYCWKSFWFFSKRKIVEPKICKRCNETRFFISMAVSLMFIITTSWI